MPYRPDIANEKAEISASLSRAGMNEIEVPVRVKLANGGLVHSLGRAFAHVNLSDPHAKGIHMSRLYLELQETLATHALTVPVLGGIAERFLQSHQETSDRAYVGVGFSLALERPALSSKFKGWRYYDVEYVAAKSSHNHEALYQASVKILYSSTCPCSAALARQLIQDKFLKDFKGRSTVDIETVAQWLGQPTSILATPHGQRSEARVKIQFNEDQCKKFQMEALIDGVELALGTPVQAAVKREDEQEFARLNGMNLMFAEDAAKKMKTFVSEHVECVGYNVEAHHFESLHPHDAFAAASHNFRDMEL